MYAYNKTRTKLKQSRMRLPWFRGVTVSTLDSESSNPSSNLGGTLNIFVWLGGVVVSALGMRTRRPRFESRVAPLFHWVATLGKLFTHIASAVSHLQETGV